MKSRFVFPKQLEVGTAKASHQVVIKGDSTKTVSRQRNFGRCHCGPIWLLVFAIGIRNHHGLELIGGDIAAREAAPDAVSVVKCEIDKVLEELAGKKRGMIGHTAELSQRTVLNITGVEEDAVKVARGEGVELSGDKRTR